MGRINWLMHLTLAAVLVLGVHAEHGDGDGGLDPGTKCGGCPCDLPCFPSPPPPPPPSLCPPPPPPPPPPPIKKCPPPPPPACGGCWDPPGPPYIIISGPPGDLYPSTSYPNSGRRLSIGSAMPLILLAITAFW